MREYINKIFCEDCLDTMREMVVDNFKVDYVLTSPVYNTTRSGESYSTQKSRDENMGRYDVYIEDKTDEEYIDFTLNIFNLFEKILNKNGCVLYNMSYSSENTELMWRVVYNIIEKTHFTIADDIIWKKKSALPNNTNPNKLTRIVEHIFVFCRRDEFGTFNTNKKVTSIREGGQKYYENIVNFIEAENNDGVCKLNKATFSTDLVLQLLDIYVEKGSVVYDPFMGTGTTAYACKIRSINYVGSEISQAQVKYASDRLTQSILF